MLRVCLYVVLVNAVMKLQVPSVLAPEKQLHSDVASCLVVTQIY